MFSMYFHGLVQKIGYADRHRDSNDGMVQIVGKYRGISFIDCHYIRNGKRPKGTT